MRPTSWLSLAGCVALGALALAAPGCGEEAPAAPEKASAETSAEAAGQGQATAGTAGRCESQLGGFLDSLDALRHRLEVGFTYGQYRGEVERLRAAYRRIPVDRLAPECLIAAGTPGERALDEYIAAANAWGTCLADAGCDSAAVEPRLQRRWRIAAGHLVGARAGLRSDLRP